MLYSQDEQLSCRRRLQGSDLILVGVCRYPCIYCGPTTKYDFDKVEQDNEEEAYHLMDNFKAALANKCGSLCSLPVH